MEIASIVILVAIGCVAILCILILQKLGRPAALPEELSARLVVLEKLVSDLPGTFRDEARVGREEPRGAVGSQTEALGNRFSTFETRLGEFGKAQGDQLSEIRKTFDTRLGEFGNTQSDQLSDMRKEASDGRAKFEDTVQRNADTFVKNQSDRLKETRAAVEDLSTKLLEGLREAREEQRNSLEAVTSKSRLADRE